MLQLLKPRILAIDDDANMCEFLRRLFEETGRYSVEVECQPLVALATARHFRPDLLIVDILMPGLSGLDLAAEVRAEPVLRNRPILFFSGVAVGNLPASFEAGGPVAYLAKGSTRPAEIVATADGLLARAGSALDQPIH